MSNGPIIAISVLDSPLARDRQKGPSVSQFMPLSPGARGGNPDILDNIQEEYESEGDDH
jgi:hypothetical protein